MAQSVDRLNPNGHETQVVACVARALVDFRGAAATKEWSATPIPPNLGLPLQLFARDPSGQHARRPPAQMLPANFRLIDGLAKSAASFGRDDDDDEVSASKKRKGNGGGTNGVPKQQRKPAGSSDGEGADDDDANGSDANGASPQQVTDESVTDGTEADKTWLPDVLAESAPIHKALRVVQKDGIVCSDWFWEAFKNTLSHTYTRVHCDQLGEDMEFLPEPPPTLSSSSKYQDVVRSFMSKFVAKGEDLLGDVDPRELPHAKYEREKLTRIYFPFDVQSTISPELATLGEVSKECGFHHEQTM